MSKQTITTFNTIIDDWRRVKNHCRTTDNKGFTETDATERFKKLLVISEHSPIRLIEFDWSWKSIPYWLSTEWSRHKFEKFISTQRDDRLKDETPRGQKPQEAPVTFDGYANLQNLIDAFRKRLCYCATIEAVELAEDFKYELHKTHPVEASVLVPNCIYRGGCCEGFSNECKFFEKFVERNKDVNMFNISDRYDAYNHELYARLDKKYGTKDVQ